MCICVLIFWFFVYSQKQQQRKRKENDFSIFVTICIRIATRNNNNNSKLIQRTVYFLLAFDMVATFQYDSGLFITYMPFVFVHSNIVKTIFFIIFLAAFWRREKTPMHFYRKKKVSWSIAAF